MPDVRFSLHGNALRRNSCYQYSTREDLTQVKLTNGEDLGGSWKRPKAERKRVEGHAFGCAFLRRCRFRSACTPRNSYRDQKESRGELNNLSLYVHNARHSVVNNNLDWTDIVRPSKGAWIQLASQLVAEGQSPTTHATALVAPQGDHIVDHERSLECDRLNCINIGQGVFP